MMDEEVNAYFNKMVQEMPEFDGILEYERAKRRSEKKEIKTPNLKIKVKMADKILEKNRGLRCVYCDKKTQSCWWGIGAYIDEGIVCYECHCRLIAYLDVIHWRDLARIESRKISKKYAKAVLRRRGLSKIEIINELNRKPRVIF